MKECIDCLYYSVPPNQLPCVKCEHHRGFVDSWKQMTIADKIRSLSDDELAKALSDIWFDDWPHGNFCPSQQCPDPWDSCVSCIAAWLKKEVEECD